MKATVDAIADGMYHPSMTDKMNGWEVRKGELEAFLSDAAEPPPLLHPNMAMHYRIRIEELYVALQEDSEAKWMVAADIIRSLVKEIILTPEASCRTTFAAILLESLAFRSKREPPPLGRGIAI
jgi:site-specific DNA recombinase